jgi:2-oxoglutarate dehydrogenase E1 component
MSGDRVSKSLQELYDTSHLSGGNAAYIESMYEDWLEDETSVPPHWATLFAGLRGASQTETGHLAVQERFRRLGPAISPVDVYTADRKEAAVVKLISAYRLRGHENAKLDPLGLPHYPPVADLDPAYHDLEASDLDREFDSGSLVAPPRMTLREIIALCDQVYCASIAIEYLHISDTRKRRWLQERLEGSRGIPDVSDDERLRILRLLTAAEGLEKYLHTRYTGQKRFSLEGGESLIPLMHEAIIHSGARAWKRSSSAWRTVAG